MTSRMFAVGAAGLLAVVAVVLALIVGGRPRALLPVTLDLADGIPVTMVDLGGAAVVLLVFAALCRGAAAFWPLAVIRQIEWSQVSAVTVFLVAQLNGIRDVAALVALYALTAAASLLLVLHARSGTSRWPFSFGAAVGIVPWGVIALYQITSTALGIGPDVLVRVITIVMLAVAFAYWVLAFHHRLSEWLHTVLIVVGVGLFAAAALLLA